MLDCFKEMLRGVIKAFDWMEMTQDAFKVSMSTLALLCALFVFLPLSYYLTFHTALKMYGPWIAKLVYEIVLIVLYKFMIRKHIELSNIYTSK